MKSAITSTILAVLALEAASFNPTTTNSPRARVTLFAGFGKPTPKSNGSGGGKKLKKKNVSSSPLPNQYVHKQASPTPPVAKVSSNTDDFLGNLLDGLDGGDQKPMTLAESVMAKVAQKNDGITSASNRVDSSDGDYSVFPVLDPQVAATLQPAPPELATKPLGPLPSAVLDQLGYVHGFDDFDGVFQGGCKFPGVRVLHADPLVLEVADFLTASECDELVAASLESASECDALDGGKTVKQVQSKTLGKDDAAKSQRTSTTWFHSFESVPALMAKACALLGLWDVLDGQADGADGGKLASALRRWEEPQTVRYRFNEKFTWHLDALPPDQDDDSKGKNKGKSKGKGRKEGDQEGAQGSAAGQRVATLLVYLADLPDGGGATAFRDLGPSRDTPLKVRPVKGNALLFFPAAGGLPGAPFDVRTLHAGEPNTDGGTDKWIAQLWLREGGYEPTVPLGNSQVKALAAVEAYSKAQPEAGAWN